MLRKCRSSSLAINWSMTWTSRVELPIVSNDNSGFNFIHCFIETGASNASKMSFSQRVADAKRKEAAERPDWDATTTGEKKGTAEDRVASKIAQEVLRDNAKLRAVHSGPSIKKLLEREAKKQM